MQAKDLKGKRVLVTGSTLGIGKAIALAFAQQGSVVFVNGRSKESVQNTVEHLKKETGNEAIFPIVADVSTAEGAKIAIEEVDKHGELDVLVNNVGFYSVVDFFSADDDVWQNHFQVNLMSAVRLSRYYLKKMLDRNSGRVLLISSEAGARPIPHMIPYSVSKSAMNGLARGLAELTKGTNVTVNSVLAGPTWTEGVATFCQSLAKAKGKTLEQTVTDYFKEGEPTSLLQRFLKPEEVSSVVVFLASQLAAGINGCAQRVEGGIVRSIH